MTCETGKLRYPSIKSARRHRRGKDSRGSRLRIYHCHLCGGYHFTSQGNNPVAAHERKQRRRRPRAD